MLILDHLPPVAPSRVLDMGCGYGALGLPVAAQFPQAQVEMVDRDLLAVETSQLNAAENLLNNVVAYGSLGFRDLKNADQPYDWILCNVPARIGHPFIRNLVEEGRTRLSSNGEMRLVVIRDLGLILEKMAEDFQWEMKESARGPRHVVYSFSSSAQLKNTPDANELYLRDQVKVQNLVLNRPFDLGGDDPKRLSAGLPVLFDALPRQAVPQRIFCFRAGYGSIALAWADKWKQAEVVAVDRDLLATHYLKMNADLHGLEQNLKIRENAHFPNAFLPDEKFDLILGELLPSAGFAVAQAEVQAISEHLNEEGQAILYFVEKIEKEWLKLMSSQSNFRFQFVLRRDGYAAYRIINDHSV